MDFQYEIAIKLKEQKIHSKSKLQMSKSMNAIEKTERDKIICDLAIRLNRLTNPKRYMIYAI